MMIDDSTTKNTCLLDREYLTKDVIYKK